MMGEASRDAGVTITVLASSTDESAMATCDLLFLCDARDERGLERLSRGVDVVTFDHELVDLDHVVALESRGVIVRPSAAAIRFAVDKAYQRQELAAAGLPVPRFLIVSSASDKRLPAFLDECAGPPVVKAARGGYDGRGVLFPADRDETFAMIDEVCVNGDAVIEERLVLEGEVAQLVARGEDGALALYPLVTTVQSKGMCIEVRFPADVSPEILRDAGELGTRLAALIGVVGMLAVELFVTDRGLVINEVALRPHNSGHWTIEGTRTSQFVNHLRAVSGQPLGDVATTTTCAVMVNVVGAERPGSLDAALEVEGAFVHDYGKSWRPGRKLGHVTVVGDDAHGAHVTAWEGARAYGTRTKET